VRVITAIGAMLALSLPLTGCGGSGDARTISFHDGSKQAYLLVLLGPSSAPYTLKINHFNPEQSTLNHGAFDAPREFNGGGSDQPMFVARVVDPGTYVITAVNQQRMWGLCFNKNTRQFTVHPGEAVFLGEFRPEKHLAQIQAIASGSGDTTRSVNNIGYYDADNVPPQITSPGADTPDFLAAKKYESQSLPDLHGRLSPAVYKPAQYEMSLSCMW